MRHRRRAKRGVDGSRVRFAGAVRGDDEAVGEFDGVADLEETLDVLPEPMRSALRSDLADGWLPRGWSHRWDRVAVFLSRGGEVRVRCLQKW